MPEVTEKLSLCVAAVCCLGATGNTAILRGFSRCSKLSAVLSSYSKEIAKATASLQSLIAIQGLQIYQALGQAIEEIHTVIGLATDLPKLQTIFTVIIHVILKYRKLYSISIRLCGDFNEIFCGNL